MAVKDEGDVHPTESLVSNLSRKHYRIPVRSQHWQLRSLVSAERQSVVYFPGGNSSNYVQRLDTTTRECETIKLLAFAPRCLVAEKGWLCCGSESGDFMAMRLDDESEIVAQLESEGLDSRDESIFAIISRARRANKSLIAKSMKLAKHRVNCVTLWFPPTSVAACETAYDEPVAILANNDRTVALVSLNDFDKKEKTEPLEVVKYPDYVNRALISPDGQLLIAILDDPYLYIHERVRKAPESPSLSSRRSSYQWTQTQRILLKSQSKVDESTSRGSFAACFSNSGAYLAVGTQHGTISIFNSALLRDPAADPLITTFQSSRPQSPPGAVRDMAFCPGPFDILAWTEDRGNVGLTDMRTNFVCRQIVKLDDPSFEHINILDRNTIDPRLLETRRDRRDNTGLGSTSLAGSSDSRQRRTDRLDTLNSPLTATETVVLEAIQNDRRRRERVMRNALADTSPRLLNSLLNNRARRTTANDGDSRRDAEGDRQDGDSRRGGAGGEPRRGAADVTGSSSSDANPTTGEVMAYRDHRERNQDRTRTSRQLLRDAAARGEAQDPGRRPDQRWMDSLGETVAMLREQRQRQDAPYLTILEILQARDRSDQDDDTSLLVPLVNQVVNRWDESATRGTLVPDHGVFEVAPSPDNTAGLAWSEDGRILFVGAQNGIYELHINVQGRKYCPGIEPR